ncbi:MAG: hypothetical protein EXS36_15350 [Pedosphaera sp.]|nr:hypothetical protein [Pedosphaera sp.]
MKIIPVLLVLLARIPFHTFAVAVVLSPVADTGIFSLLPDNNFGSVQSLILGGINQAEQRGRVLLKFDLAAGIPAGAGISITSVKL